MWPFRKPSAMVRAARYYRKLKPDEYEWVRLNLRRCDVSDGGLFFAYHCDLKRGHPLPHEAVIGRTFTEDFRGRRETGRTTRRWPATL